jgi:hypothetical protein
MADRTPSLCAVSRAISLLNFTLSPHPRLRPSHDNCHNMHSTSRTLTVRRFNVDVASGSDDYWKDLGGCREIGWRRESSKCCWYELSRTYKKHPLISLRMHLVPHQQPPSPRPTPFLPPQPYPAYLTQHIRFSLGPNVGNASQTQPQAPPEMRNSVHSGRLCHHTPSLRSLFTCYM